MRAGEQLSAWSESIGSVLESLSVDPAQGLETHEADRRRMAFGPNEFAATRQRHVLTILKDQFGGVVTLLLLIAGWFALLMSDFAEAIAIFAVILINATIGFLTEWRATRSMEELRRLARVSCVVLRDAEVRRTGAEELVPGDIVVLEAGDMVPADLRLIETKKLSIDESTLTGESMPVDKETGALDEPTPIFARSNMAYKGTAIARGSGRGVVAATAMDTEFGKIFAQVREARPHRTPLEKRLDALGKRLAWVVISISVILVVIGILTGRELELAIQVAIALAVAAIPEGLPIVATIALARGMWRMARRNALITRLSAVETLGATSIILTDKTGTLTENRMTVTTALLAGGEIALRHPPDGPFAPLLDAMLRTATLCNGAVLQRAPGGRRAAVGDPTECALLEAAASRGIWQQELLLEAPEVHEDPFDPDSKRMATAHDLGGSFKIAVKGAPEVLIDYCDRVAAPGGAVSLTDARKRDWLRRVDALCERGLRTLAVADKTSASWQVDLYSGLTLQGVFGIEDPPRAGVAETMQKCRSAGVTVIMVTGDHANTAKRVATDISVIDETADSSLMLTGESVDRLLADRRDDELLAARVFSRVTPAQKLGLIELYQKQGHVVAMTGDGVNDAPALKKADIGVAMGIRGTAVAREASEMVLEDDELGTIVSAIGHGRAIFENIRKFVLYLLSCNTSEILVISLATLAGAPLPLLPLQILFLNLVTDVFPALALGVGPSRAGLMDEAPRPTDESILARGHWVQIGLYGVVLAVVTLAAMAYALVVLDFATGKAVSVAFGTLALAQLWHVFNMRGDVGRVFDNEITRNPWVWGALGLCLGLVLIAIYMPVLNDVLQLADPGTSGWLVIIIASVVPLAVAPLVRRLAR